MPLIRLFTAAVLAVCFSIAAPAAAPIPVVLDTDIGDDIDDALALSLALQSPELKVLAINTVLQDGRRRADLAWKILELYGRTDIPVGVGAEAPLLAPPRTGPVRQTALLPADYHMKTPYRNGLQLLIDTCLKSAEKVTVLAYGPLTNIGIALRAEPALRDHIERIVLMNGVFFRAGLEYNTQMDPEAAEIVYNSGLPVKTVGLDVTMQCRLNASSLRQMQESPQESVQFLLKLIRIWQEGHADRYPILHDPLSIAVTVRPDLIGTARGAVHIETRGTPEQTYGMCIFRPDPSGKVEVAERVNAGGAVDLFLSRVLAAPRAR